jgi:hypothetical protein
MTHRFVVRRLLFVTLLLVPAAARASETFPVTLRNTWQVGKLPVKGEGCLLCHMTDPGLGTNVQRPFGVTVKSFGAKKADAGSLQRALTSMRAQGSNSDGDPVSDYFEIAIDGTNPNDGNSFVVPTPEGGSGGEGGAADSAGAGGDMAVGGPYFPPGGFSGPPPYEHGCSLVARAGASPKCALTLLVLVAVVVGLSRRALRRPS